MTSDASPDSIRLRPTSRGRWRSAWALAFPVMALTMWPGSAASAQAVEDRIRMRGTYVGGIALILLAACSGPGTGAHPASTQTRTPPPAQSGSATPTLDGVRRKGFVQCGVTTGVAGFSSLDAKGEWVGLDVDLCRAVAAAVLGDATKVRFTPLTAIERFTALQSGEIDLLSRVTTVTFQRDVQLGMEFPVINWYDGTGFIVPKRSGVTRVEQLDGATICMQPGNTNAGDAANYFRAHGLRFTPVVIERLEEATSAYFAGRCDAFIQDRSSLAAVRARAPDPTAHVVLPEVVSKSPFGPAVMPNDIRWMEIVRWSFHAMVDAEELGLTSATIAQVRDTTADPMIQQFVGRTGSFGAMLGVAPDWAFQIVRQVGNYGESFDRNVKPLGIDRGINRLWRDGGILYAPDLR